jgi:4-hydroxybenzoate polyprenyltransferase
LVRPAVVFLKEIRVEHTLFALPFAYTGAVFAAHGIPGARDLLWITLAVLGARTAAMAANRYLDRDVDARNPRTARRALVTGTIPAAAMVWAVAAGLALLVAAAFELNPLCVRLLPVAAAGILFYPLCKRFTWLTHFFLGAVDGLAPLGAFIAVAGKVDAAALLLFGAVTAWVAGFDVIYALMDLPIDRAQRISSLPARFGERSARIVPLALHLFTAALLAGAGILEGAGRWYWIGVAACVALVLYEDRLPARSRDVFTLNERVFTANMSFSVVFLVTAVLGFTLR